VHVLFYNDDIATSAHVFRAEMTTGTDNTLDTGIVGWANRSEQT